MKKNVGSVERVIRLALAAVLAGLYFTGTLSGTIGIIALVVAVVMLLTASVAFCPIYTILGVMFGASDADEDPHKSGVCCGHCGSEDAGDEQPKDGPPIFN